MSNGTSTIRVTNKFDFGIILATLAAICFIIYLLIRRYPTATDAATMAGVIFPSLAAIVAAAFGISQAAKAEAAENAAAQATDEKKAVDEKLEKVKKIKPELKEQFAQLEQVTESPLKIVETLGRSDSGARSYIMNLVSEGKGASTSVDVDVDDLVSARVRLERIRALLDQLAE
jgi:hypothetical protein